MEQSQGIETLNELPCSQDERDQNEIQVKYETNPLHSACFFERAAVALWLINNGINIADTDDEGWTALHIACFNGFLDIALMLLENKAPINAQDNSGWTPLHMACSNSHYHVSRALIEAGADLRITNKLRKNAASYVASSEEREALLNLFRQRNNNEIFDEDEIFIAFEAKAEETTASNCPTKQVVNANAYKPQINDIRYPFPSSIYGPIREAINRALCRGKRRWARSKLMIVGQGRVGKSAIANSIIGVPFSDTVSTQGLNILPCDVRAINPGLTTWKLISRPEKELEVALARMVLEEKDPASDESMSKAKYYSGTPASRQFEDVYENEFGRNRNSSVDDPELDDLITIGPMRVRSKSESTPVPKLTDEQLVIIPIDKIDNEIVIQSISNGVLSESKFSVNIFDFGGQSIFNIIQPFFLTRLGVYLVVFNMQSMLSPSEEIRNESLTQVIFWVNSVIAQTINSEGDTAAIAFVGTHRDAVGSCSDHLAISKILEDTFCLSAIWKNVIENVFDEQYQQALSFFPVDNTQSSSDAEVAKLTRLIDKRIEESDYVHVERPLTWLQLYDVLQSMKQDYMSLDVVTRIAREYFISESEVLELLSLFHEMGMLMWHEEETLRDTVIFDPIKCFVAPASLIICDHLLNGQSIHENSIHKKCKKFLRREYESLVTKGILSNNLLFALLEDYSKSQIRIIIKLMLKYGMIVELKGCATEKSYIIPSLLSKDRDISSRIIPIDASIIDSWESRTHSTFYFAFTTWDHLSKQQVITAEDLQQSGFLPSGLFERLISKAVNWSQQTSDYFLTVTLLSLKRNVAVLCYGNQEFRLIHRSQSNCIQVDVLGENPKCIHKRLDSQLQLLVQECMQSLHFFTCLPVNSLPENCAIQSIAHSIGIGSSRPSTAAGAAGIEGRCLEDATRELVVVPLLQVLDHHPQCCYPISTRSQCKQLLPEEFAAMFKQWLVPSKIMDSYDIYFSYQWNVSDYEFVGLLQDFLTNYSIGANHKTVDTFLDQNKLKSKHEFQTPFCRALVNSKIVLAIVSSKVFKSLIAHNPNKCDNIIVEWICAIACCRMRKRQLLIKHSSNITNEPNQLRKIITIQLAQGDDDCISNEEQLTALLNEIPSIKPTESVNRAIVLLHRLNITLDEKMQEFIMKLTVKNVARAILRCRINTNQSVTNIGPSYFAGHIMKDLRKIYQDSGLLDDDFDGDMSGHSSCRLVCDSAGNSSKSPAVAIPDPTVMMAVSTSLSMAMQKQQQQHQSQYQQQSHQLQYHARIQNDQQPIYRCNGVPVIISSVVAKRALRGAFMDTRGRIESCIIKFRSDQDRAEDFDFEIRNLKQLKGRINTVVELYDVTTEGRVSYFVMEEFGEPLTSVLVPSCPGHSCEVIALKLIDAIDRLHCLGLMHGDIKPENILIKHNMLDFEVKLCDLESCRFAGLEDFPHFNGQFRYSRDYACPELVGISSALGSQRPGTLKASLAIDNFALGLVLWQLFNNQSQPLLANTSDADYLSLLTDQSALDSKMRGLKHCSSSSTYIAQLCKLEPESRLKHIRQLESDLQRRTNLQRVISTKDEAIAAARSEIEFLRRDVSEGIELIQSQFGSFSFAIQQQANELSANIVKSVRQQYCGQLNSDAKNEFALHNLKLSLLLSTGKLQNYLLLQNSIDGSEYQADNSTSLIDILSAFRSDIEPNVMCSNCIEEMITQFKSQSASQKEIKEAINILIQNSQQLFIEINSIQNELHSVKSELKRSGEILREALVKSEKSDKFNQLIECTQRIAQDVLTSNASQIAHLRNDISALQQSLGSMPNIESIREIKEQLKIQITSQSTMLSTLLANTHAVPTLVLVLPAAASAASAASASSTSSTSLVRAASRVLDPRNLVTEQYVLYFICSHTLEIVSCGPSGNGYPFRRVRSWVQRAAPFLLVGLSLLQLGLSSAGVPIPIPGLSQLFDSIGSYQSYIDAAIEAMRNQLDQANAEDLTEAIDAASIQSEGSREAYLAVKELMDEFDPALKQCGLRFVTDSVSGLSAWIADDNIVEESFRSHQGRRLTAAVAGVSTATDPDSSALHCNSSYEIVEATITEQPSAASAIGSDTSSPSSSRVPQLELSPTRTMTKHSSC